MDKLLIEYVDPKTLIPNKYRSRKSNKANDDAIQYCIGKNSFIVPVLIDDKNVIISGHARVEAAIALGLPEIPIIKIKHLNEAQKRAFMLFDNKIVERGIWDFSALGRELKFLIDINFDMSLTGFTTPEIDLHIGDAAGLKEDNLPETTSGVSVSQLGDIWQCGNHRVYCGNSLERICYEVVMGDKKAQCIITDPPYNVPIDKHVSGLGKNKHREFAMGVGEMSSPGFTTFLSDSISNLIEFSIDGSIHFIFMDWRHLSEILQAGTAYTELKNICVWVKDNAGMGSFYRSQHEMILVYKNGKAKHINNFGLGEHRYRTNVWEYAGANSFKGRSESDQDPLSMHPTVKPVSLLSEAIKDCSTRNGIILDPFLGSGSTLIAAEKTGRHCYGIEIDPLYVDVIIRRWQNLTGKDAINANTGKTFNQTQGDE